ncbi:MAG: ShlB/FhaC/HecB family hemolysin secretion/activation protein, partial [Proteobacteria bacterium]|nr:ShlB/FhaC/HecB family hemolysin secretion/activation protein [Pseudomonadota bacterium]
MVFRGNTVFPTGELEAIAAPYLRRNIGMPDLEELRLKLTRHYVDRGYVNSGVLQAKESSSGVAVFEVIEGRLTAIHLRGLERLDENYVARRLAKDRDGPLSIDVLRERYQLLLDDPLIQRMNARLMPAARLGEAILDIDLVRARPYQLTAFVNNYRPPSIGSEAAGMSGWVRNLTGYGDVLEASLQDSPRDGGSPRASLGWRMPINQQGTQLSLQLEHGRSSVIEEPIQTLDIKSTLDSRDIGLSQNLV